MTDIDAQIAGVEASLQERAIEYLMVQFVDIHGAAKVKLVPARYLRGTVEVERSGEWAKVRNPTTCTPGPI
jgi:glutamine synthetase